MIEFRDWYAGRGRRAADRPHQRGGDRRRHAAVHGRHAALLRPAQDQGAARRARGRQLRRGVRRRAARRGAVARQGARLLAARRRRASGIRSASGRSCGTCSTAGCDPGESIRVFPLSNWTELDVWQYIHVENIPIVPLYFAQGARGHRPRQLADRCSSSRSCRCMPGERPQRVMCRMRSLGCSPCTGAVRSDGRHGAEDHRGAGRGRGSPSGSCASSTTTRTARWS